MLLLACLFLIVGYAVPRPFQLLGEWLVDYVPALLIFLVLAGLGLLAAGVLMSVKPMIVAGGVDLYVLATVIFVAIFSDLDKYR